MKKFIMTLLVLTSVLTCSGCIFGSSNHKSTKDSVQKYLKEKYPNEKFDITYYGETELSGDDGGCDNAKGNTWNVKAEDTNISFYVQDEYIFNSFSCEYTLDDNYFDIYLTNTIKEINDSRIKIDDVTDPIEKGYGFLPSISSIDFDINDFSSKEELAQFMIDVRSKLLTDSRIKEELDNSYKSFWFDVFDGEKILYSINFSLSNSVDYILEEINKKEAKQN